MKIESSLVTKLKISELDSLDPITVIAEDFYKGRGQITITCFGKAWTAYWGAIGDRPITEFFCSCDEYYIAKNISDVPESVIDYDDISKMIGEEVDHSTLMLHADKVEEVYGPDWYMDLPQTTNSEYEYICRIIIAVQAALRAHI